MKQIAEVTDDMAIVVVAAVSNVLAFEDIELQRLAFDPEDMEVIEPDRCSTSQCRRDKGVAT